MNQGKKLLPILLIGGGIIIGLVTCQRQSSQQQQAKAQLEVSQSPQAEKQKSEVASKPKLAVDRIRINYQCEQNKTVQALYENIKPAVPKVMLTIDGKPYQLYNIPSQVGSLYATEQGINPGQGMRWHIQGLEARLVSLSVDQNAPTAKEQLLMRCQEPV